MKEVLLLLGRLQNAPSEAVQGVRKGFPAVMVIFHNDNYTSLLGLSYLQG